MKKMTVLMTNKNGIQTQSFNTFYSFIKNKNKMERKRWTPKEDRIVKATLKKAKKPSIAAELLEDRLTDRTYSAICQRIVKFRSAQKNKKEKSSVKVVKRMTFNGDHVRLYF